jgi:hypothetical protein
MNNWKIVGTIATGFGVVAVVFAVFSAILTYDYMNLQAGYYSTTAIQLNVLSSMFQYLLLAALSFVTAGFSLRATREKQEKEEQPPEEQTEVQPTETET